MNKGIENLKRYNCVSIRTAFRSRVRDSVHYRPSISYGAYSRPLGTDFKKRFKSQAKKISQNDSGLSSFNAGNVNDHCGDDESIFGTFPRRSKGSKGTIGTKTPLSKLDLDEGKHYKELNYLQEQAKKLIDFDQDLTLDQEMILSTAKMLILIQNYDGAHCGLHRCW